MLEGGASLVLAAIAKAARKCSFCRLTAAGELREHASVCESGPSSLLAVFKVHSKKHHASLPPCRDLPRLIDIVQGGSSMGTAADEAVPSSSSSSSSSGSEGYGLPRRGGRAAAMNVQLSGDETCEC